MFMVDKFLVYIFIFLVVSSNVCFSKEKFDTYRVIGKADTKKDAYIDAYQNAMIEFIKSKISPVDIKQKSSSILKTLFPIKTLTNLIYSQKVISEEVLEGETKVVLDIQLDEKKIVELLKSIDIVVIRKNQEYSTEE